MTAGRLVLVVGASGAGKDSVIGYARSRLAGRDDVVFPPRIVTRAPDATEQPDTMDLARFEHEEALGHFLVSWRAHGLAYALPGWLEDDLRHGRQVVANVSRAIIPALCARFTCCVVMVEAGAALRRARIAARGREEGAAIDARVRRSVARPLRIDACIRNEGTLAEAGEALVALVTGGWRA